MTLTNEDIKFLEAIHRHEQRSPINEPATAKRLPLATRAQDKARQRCRKLGLARRVNKRDGYNLSGWELTPMGRAEVLGVQVKFVPQRETEQNQ